MMVARREITKTRKQKKEKKKKTIDVVWKPFFYHHLPAARSSPMRALDQSRPPIILPLPAIDKFIISFIPRFSLLRLNRLNLSPHPSVNELSSRQKRIRHVKRKKKKQARLFCGIKELIPKRQIDYWNANGSGGAAFLLVDSANTMRAPGVKRCKVHRPAAPFPPTLWIYIYVTRRRQVSRSK